MSKSVRIVVTTEPTLLTPPEEDSTPGSSSLIKNTGSQTIYVGGEDVTVAEGYPMAVGEFVSADLGGRRDSLYGRVATGTGEVRDLRMGV